MVLCWWFFGGGLYFFWCVDCCVDWGFVDGVGIGFWLVCDFGCY